MTARSSEGLDERRRRLLYRAWHRGLLEADLIAGPFADAHIGTLSGPDVDQFERLLEVPSPQFVRWVLGSERPPPEQASELFQKLCAFHNKTTK